MVITFDDGFKCFSSLIAPILHELSLPATFFIPSDAIGAIGKHADNFSLHNLKRHGIFDFVSEADCRTLANDPLFEIGGHTKSHLDLGRKHSVETYLREIKEDKIVIERLLLKKIKFLAYPFGGIKNVSEASARAIQNAGYLASFTIIPSFWKKSDNHFFIGRDSLSITDSEELWSAWLNGGYDFVSRLKNFLIHYK